MLGKIYKRKKHKIEPSGAYEGAVMLSIEWILKADTYDPSYPFVSYAYLIVIAVIIHSWLVVWPMIRIYRRFTKERLENIVDKIKKTLTEKQKIDLKNWIKSEIFFMLIPALIALSIRIFAGEPEDFLWTNPTLIVGFALASIWISLQIWQAIEMNRILNPMLYKMYHPKLISGGLGIFNLTKERLEILAKLEPEYVERPEEEIAPMQSIIAKNDDGGIRLDGQAVVDNLKELGSKVGNTMHNIGQFGKSLVGQASGKTVEAVDNTIQNKVDSITKPTLYTKIHKRTIVFTIAFLPLLAIYVILPFMS